MKRSRFNENNLQNEIIFFEIANKTPNEIRKMKEWCKKFLKENCTPNPGVLGGIEYDYFVDNQINNAEYIFYRQSDINGGFLTGYKKEIHGRIRNQKKYVFYIDAVCAIPQKGTLTDLLKKVEEWAVGQNYDLLTLRAAWSSLVRTYKKQGFVLGAGGEISSTNPSGKQIGLTNYNACNNFEVGEDLDENAYRAYSYQGKVVYDGTADGWWMSKCIRPEQRPDLPLPYVSTKGTKQEAINSKEVWKAGKKQKFLRSI